MSSIFSSQSIRTNDIESVGGGPLDIGRFSTGNIVVGSSDNTVAVADALLIFVDNVNNNYIDTIGTNPLLIGTQNANQITIGGIGGAGADGNIYIGKNSSVLQEGAIVMYDDLFIYKYTDPNPLVGASINFDVFNDSLTLNLSADPPNSVSVNIGGNGSVVTLNGTTEIGRLNNTPTYSTFISVISTVSQNAMRFYSNQNFNQYGSSIVATGGTAVANKGTLTITADTITLSGQVSISASGTIATPNATTRVAQAFGTTFTSTLPPKVYLTYDAGATSLNIITVCLAGFVGVANAWTGFYYLTSTSSAGVADSKLNWVAIA